MKYFFPLFIGIFIQASAFTQIEGSNLFQNDQVIIIDLEFPDANFWTLLTNNYEADANEYIPAHLTITDETGTYSMDSVAVRLKGNSSYSHPGNKKSFKIDFNKYIAGQNHDGIKKLNFSNGFKDPSLLREKIFFDVCRDAGVPAPRANFATVTMNGTPWGFYTMIEQIDDQFLDWKMADDNGNLFKAGDNFGVPGGGNEGTPADLMNYGNNQSSYTERYELKTNEIENDWTDLIALIDFINNSDDNTFENGLDDVLEVQDFLRSAALDILFSNLDSYTGSARNYYIYHNLSTGKWEWVKWDGNESFGSYTNNAGNMISLAIDYRNENRPLLDRIFESDLLYERYLFEICYLSETFFNSQYINPKCDALKELIQNDVYADNNKMYSNADFDSNIESNITAGGGPGGGNVLYGIKSFVEARNAFILGQLDCSSIENPNAIDNINTTDFLVYPNPSKEYLFVQQKANEKIQIELLNNTGQMIYQSEFSVDNLIRLDLTKYVPGLYFVRIKSPNQEVKTTRIMLQ